jgi:hypothetical protein
MPDDLYWDDTLLWSERQATLLRRIAAGERVNDLDWEHVIEEIEDVGKTELRACTSLLRRAIEHLLTLHLLPSSEAVPHWRGEARTFLFDARKAFSPAMRQHIDLADIFAELREGALRDSPAALAAALPQTCPFTLDDLLANRADLDALLGKLAPPAPAD